MNSLKTINYQKFPEISEKTLLTYKSVFYRSPYARLLGPHRTFRNRKKRFLQNSFSHSQNKLYLRSSFPRFEGLFCQSKRKKIYFPWKWRVLTLLGNHQFVPKLGKNSLGKTEWETLFLSSRIKVYERLTEEKYGRLLKNTNSQMECN